MVPPVGFDMCEESEETKSKGKLEAKLKLLKFTREKSGAVITGSNIVAMERGVQHCDR